VTTQNAVRREPLFTELPRAKVFSETQRVRRHKKRARTATPQPLIHLLRTIYLSRSLALPNLSLAVPFVWSERPSDFYPRRSALKACI
jgi:hypothetical protein